MKIKESKKMSNADVERFFDTLQLTSTSPFCLPVRPKSWNLWAQKERHCLAIKRYNRRENNAKLV